MPTEFEAKFLNINENEIKDLLLKLGAKKVHDKIMLKRTVFSRCDESVRGFARVRDEGNGKVTMTSKLYTDPKFPEEYEVAITDSYETGCKFMESLGLKPKAKQESQREKWSHDLAHEITFDTVPGLPTYMEIDCTSEANLNKLITMLGLDKSAMRFGSFDATYEEYYGIEKDVIDNKTPSLTFSNIINEIKPTKNKDMLERIYKSYNLGRSLVKRTSKKKAGSKKKVGSKKTSKKPSKKPSKKTSKKLSKRTSKKRMSKKK